MKAKSLMLPIIILPLLWSCRTEIEFNLEERQSKIVINSLLYVNEVITCYVHRTNFALESNHSITPLPDALVLLEIDGVIADTLRHIGWGKFESKHIARQDKIYRFIVSRVDYPTASAKSSIISSTQFIKLEKIGDGQSSSGAYFTKFRLTFEKDPNNKGFYAFVPIVNVWHYLVDINDSTSYLRPMYVDIERSVGIEFSKESYRLALPSQNFVDLFYFTDKLTDSDNKAIIEFSIEHFYSSEDWIKNMYLVVEKLSEDMFLYEQSLSLLLEGSGFGLFVQPTQVYNNVENGMGILGTCLRYPPIFLNQ